MKHIRGTARDVKRKQHVSGSHGSVQTTHTVTLAVDGTPVELSIPEALFISDGDVLEVAGFAYNGIVDALAFVNKTNHTKGHRKILGYKFGFPCATALALACLTLAARVVISGEVAMAFLVAVLALVFLFIAYVCRDAWRARTRAVALVFHRSAAAE